MMSTSQTTLQTTHLNESHHDVCIIGAGISGLSAAQTLGQKNLKIVVLEKSRGPGGRMATRRMDGYQFNHGAPSFTLENPNFIAWAHADARKDSLQISQLQPSPPNYKATASANFSMNLLARSIFTPPNFHTLIRVTALVQLQTPLKVQLPALHWQVQFQRENPAGEVLERGTLTADNIVLALPAPQAAALLQPLPAQFTELAQLAASVKYDACWVAIFSLLGPSGIATNEFGEATISADAPFSKCIRQAGINTDGSESWVVHASVTWTNKHLNDSKETVGDALFSAFLTLCNGIEKPVVLAAHRWLYGQPATNNIAGADHADASDQAAKNGLFCIGDWLNTSSSTNSMSHIERAWLSGQQLQILQILQRQI
jgi:renalase